MPVHWLTTAYPYLTQNSRTTLHIDRPGFADLEGAPADLRWTTDFNHFSALLNVDLLPNSISISNLGQKVNRQD